MSKTANLYTSSPPPYSEPTDLATQTNQNTYLSEKAIAGASSAYEVSVRKILHINAYGKDWNDYSTHGRETEISITTSSDHEEYRNIRPNPSRGSCTLFHHDSTGRSLSPVSETIYRMGPGRPPIVKLFHGEKGDQTEDVIIHSKNVFSRSIVFESASLGTYTWRYASRGYFNCLSKKAESVLILEKLEGEDGKVAVEMARLVRNKETRTEGTRWNEGNGGRLEMKAGLGDELEVLVLSTCLVMLKKEVDQLLGNQVAVIT